MEKIIAFSNPGKIDPRVWSTFGVSAKETDSAIGQFGTGLKYAIAVLMREGRSLKIKSGKDEYVFGVEKTDIRGKEFSQITCNGEPLPFTTHLGSKWELWMAYREIYSNCLDEGGHIGEDGETVIYAEIGDIAHNDVFLDTENRRLISSSEYCDIYAGQSDWIFYKGIKAKEPHRRCFFTYNVKKADLTEDRTFKYDFEVERAISNAVLEKDNEEIAHHFLFHTKEFYEEVVNFDWCNYPPTDSVLRLVNQYRRDCTYMQRSLMSKAIQQLGATVYEKTEMDERQKAVVSAAKMFCESINHPIRYPIHLTYDLGGKVLALADNKEKCIYLSDTVIDQGVKQVASTLIEENIHLLKGYEDLTYEMQSYLFDQIVTMGERLTGAVL